MKHLQQMFGRQIVHGREYALATVINSFEC